MSDTYRIGIALSGGGFRATLYHLGVLRYLRDAGALSKVTHITSVSGGSIIAAHLALNWDAYCGSEEEFDRAAAEIVRFAQMDVRNRIVRRFPFAALANAGRRLTLLGSDRRLTRPGLLEAEYEKHLFGDRCLYQLPESPQLHILSTNVSEGCLCSFNRDGLIVQRRVPGERQRFERVDVGLATIPMAVAASSAFPAFFPPLELRAWDVGATEGEFGRQLFTDGGVFDNLGLRMFRCLEQSWMLSTSPIRPEDLIDPAAVRTALANAAELPELTPAKRVADILSRRERSGASPVSSASPEELAHRLWSVVLNARLYRDPSFANIELSDSEAESLLQYVRRAEKEPSFGDRLWLDRQLLDAALKQVTGKLWLRPAHGGFDAIFVSDAGKQIKVVQPSKQGGLISTAMRSSDILMDRVWQLELEIFEKTPEVIFASILERVSLSEDPTALHPEVQRQTSRIRTDLDAFSDLEISSLVRHGYCVTRKMLRARQELFDEELPAGPPWDPFSEEAPSTNEPSDGAAMRSTVEARALRSSSSRRIASRLLSLGDWPTYVIVPLALLFVLGLPYFLVRNYRDNQRNEKIIQAVAEMSPLYRVILRQLNDGPKRELVSMPFEEISELISRDFEGFNILSDTRIIDLRGWSRNADVGVGGGRAHTYSRVRVRRIPGTQADAVLHFQEITEDSSLNVRCLNKSLHPVLRRLDLGDGTYLWDLALDFSRIPRGQDVDVVVETLVSEDTQEDDEVGWLRFTVDARTELATMWVLMPPDRPYDSFELVAHEAGKPADAESLFPANQVDIPHGSLITFQLVNPSVNRTYECRWTWRDNLDDEGGTSSRSWLKR